MITFENYKEKMPSMAKRAERSPLAAIRLKCLDCVCYSAGEVGKCDIANCSIWPFRFGKRPSTAKRQGKTVSHNKYK